VDEHAGGARKTLERWRQGLVTGDKGGTAVDLDARPAERGASEESSGPKSEDKGGTPRRLGSMTSPASPRGGGRAEVKQPEAKAESEAETKEERDEPKGCAEAERPGRGEKAQDSSDFEVAPDRD